MSTIYDYRFLETLPEALLNPLSFGCSQLTIRGNVENSESSLCILGPARPLSNRLWKSSNVVESVLVLYNIPTQSASSQSMIFPQLQQFLYFCNLNPITLFVFVKIKSD